MTNVGTFGNIMGTPIINQPQVEWRKASSRRNQRTRDRIWRRNCYTSYDVLSLSYDHRVVDGDLEAICQKSQII